MLPQKLGVLRAAAGGRAGPLCVQARRPPPPPRPHTHRTGRAPRREPIQETSSARGARCGGAARSFCSACLPIDPGASRRARRPVARAREWFLSVLTPHQQPWTSRAWCASSTRRCCPGTTLGYATRRTRAAASSPTSRTCPPPSRTSRRGARCARGRRPHRAPPPPPARRGARGAAAKLTALSSLTHGLTHPAGPATSAGVQARVRAADPGGVLGAHAAGDRGGCAAGAPPGRRLLPRRQGARRSSSSAAAQRT